MNWVLFWLFLHVTAAIVAFGPAFVFPLMEPAVRKRPAGLGFAMLLGFRMTRWLIIPVAGTMLISGFGLVIAAQVSPFKNAWLAAGILLYLCALGIGSGHQLPNARKLAALTENLPPGPPPAEVAHLLERNTIGGRILTGLIVVIVFLMVVKPGGLVSG